MSRKARRRVVSKQLVCTALTVLLSGLLLLAASCEDLDAGTAETSTTDASDITVLFGTWDGTYTPEAAWDENGSVDDPPFELGAPVNMHMELHPYLAESGEYGIAAAGGLSPARVTSLTRLGDQVTMIAISEAEGLNDLVGVFTLTLDEDTLTGGDDRDPEVPSGWVSSSGTVELTRTAPWDASATTTTSSTVAPEPGGGGDGGGGDGADAGADDAADPEAGEGDGEPDIGIVDDEPGHATLVVGAAEDGMHEGLRVGDIAVVHFEYLPGTEVTDIFCQSTSGAVLSGAAPTVTQDPVTGYYYTFEKAFEAVAPGTADIIARTEFADGTASPHWRFTIIVTE